MRQIINFLALHLCTKFSKIINVTKKLIKVVENSGKDNLNMSSMLFGIEGDLIAYSV